MGQISSVEEKHNLGPLSKPNENHDHSLQSRGAPPYRKKRLFRTKKKNVNRSGPSAKSRSHCVFFRKTNSRNGKREKFARLSGRVEPPNGRSSENPIEGERKGFLIPKNPPPPHKKLDSGYEIKESLRSPAPGVSTVIEKGEEIKKRAGK